MPYSLITHQHDLLVIGAGGAGLRAAVAASAKSAKVACISKVPPTRSHTVAAQGGINAALGNRVPDDWRWHMYDTIRGSDWLGDQDAIALLCKEAPQAIIELEHMGMPFTRDEHGRIYQRAYGGQATDFGRGGPAYRACASADRTGHALLHTLYTQAVRHGVQFFVEYVALDLLFDEERACRGLLAWQLETGELHLFQAHATIIATGGFGQAYASTTASTICTGDGGGMALRAGLPLQDMEFIQFHPTGLYGTGILITEGARGEGAVLKNGKGERFMERYAPNSMELASRDVISRAMVQEIMAGRGAGTKQDHLLLDLTHLEPEIIDSKLPQIAEIARTFGRMDIHKQPIPVLPTVHYTMGGIPTNMYGEVISVEGGWWMVDSEKKAPITNHQPPITVREAIAPGLFAIGEAACASVHGANRLGCNALLELVVFGKNVGERAASLKHGSHKPASAEKLLGRFDTMRQSKGGTRPNVIRKALQQTMQAHAGIFRDKALLEEGAQKLQTLWQQMRDDLNVADKSLLWNNDLLEALETDNLLRQAMVAMSSALARQESRGAHSREDFPERDDAHWLKHSLASMDDSGHISLSTCPVRMEAEEPQTGEILSFKPEKRAY